MMTKKLSLSHKIMGKIAMVTPESHVLKSILKINHQPIFTFNISVLGEERRPRGAGGKRRRYQVLHTILHLAQGGGASLS